MARLFLLSCNFLALAILVTPAWALPAQGASREDRNSLQDLEPFEAAVSPDGLPRSVDLRPWLPEVGMQTMNDCAAWAFGYAGRSYLEAIDQGWLPDDPKRIFSPTFIYNQVNQGVDEGSRIDRVVELLQEKGAATLATSPYLERDFLTQPYLDARQEAKNFRIADYGVLPDGKWIRKALAEGHIVLCCVRTNPVFSSGRYSVYSKELHAQGYAARRPDQPHGFHAMAIAGYSDDREAFLFMNSWGKDWGDGGFVWVAYDVLDAFNQDGVEKELMDFAVVMFDRREPVVREYGSYRALDMDQLEVTGQGNYSGYDPEADQGEYRYFASLRGKWEMMDEIESVVWEVPGPSGRRLVTDASAKNGYRIHGRAPQSKILLRCKVTMSTGHERIVEQTIEVPETRKRQLELTRVDSFYASTAAGDQWRWTLMPQMTDADWRDLVSIRYEFDGDASPAAPEPYQHAGALPPEWNLQSLAMPSFRTAAPAGGRAFLSFRDGTEHELPFDAVPFTDPVRKELEREIVWRPVGIDGDRHWYFYELRARYPESWSDNILGVQIGTGNQIDWASHEARPTTGPGPRMHVFHGYARRPFASSVSATFREEQDGLGRTTPVTDYDIHAFGEACAWFSPPVEDPDLLISGRGYGIESRDRFVGIVDGRPTWEFQIYLEGTANVMAIDSVEWTSPDGVAAFSRDDDSNPHPIDGYLWTRRDHQPFPVKLKATFYNGESFEIDRTIRPYEVANTALAVDLTDRTPSELAELAPDLVLAGVSVHGSSEQLQELREITAYPRRSWGGVLPTQVHAWEFNRKPEPGAELARVELIRNQETPFLLRFDDGSTSVLRALPHALAPQATLPRLQLFARERFVGWVDGTPQWQAKLELLGELALLEEVDRVEWNAAGNYGAAASVEADGLTATAHTTEPAEVRAVVHFVESLGREPAELVAELWTMSERPEGLSVRTESGWVPEPVGIPVDPWSMPQPAEPYRMRLHGDPSTLAQLEAVSWKSWDSWALKNAEEDGEEPPAPSISRMESDQRASGFAWETAMYADQDDVIVQAVLHWQDRREEALDAFTLNYETPLVEVLRPTPTVQLRPWGEVDGQPMSLLIAGVPNGYLSEYALRTQFVFAEGNVMPWRGLAASNERPVTRRAFLVTAADRLSGYQILERDPDDFRFEEEEHDHEGEQAIAPIAIPELSIALHEEAGTSGSFYFLHLNAAEAQLAETLHVEWKVTQDGVARTYTIADRVGERSDAFELRLSGSSPSAAEAVLHGAEGPLVGGKVDWKAP